MSRQRLFKNRWWIVFGSTLGLVVGQGPVSTFTFGVFLKPVSEEFGWDRGAVSAALGISVLITAIASPFIGRAIDRWGVRRVLLPSIVLFALCFAALSLTPGSLTVFIASYALVGVSSAIQNPPPYVKVIAAWFDRRRGLALGIAMSGVGIGVFVMPQIARVIIGAYGWRPAYVVLGGVVLLVGVSAVTAFLPEPQDAPRQSSPHERARLPGHDVKEALRSRHFWLLAISMFLAATVVNGVIVHVVPILTDRGMSMADAAWILGSAGLATIAGRILAGYLVDWLFAPYVTATFFLLPCIGIYLLVGGLGGVVAPLTGVILCGLASGCEVDQLGYLTSRYFGLRRLGEIYGYMFAVFAGGTALGPYLMGVTYDVFHSYTPALLGFAIVMIIASILVGILGPYVYRPKAVYMDAEGGPVTQEAAT